MALIRVLALAAALFACAPAHSPADLTRRELPGSDGQRHALIDPSARLTVLEFFSAHCKCQAAHDARWRELVQTFEPRGVAFRMIDSERGASVARDRQLATERGYRQ